MMKLPSLLSLLLPALLAAAAPAGAQDEAVSTEEMCTGFRQQYLETERYRTPQGFTATRPVVRLDTAGYDRVYFGYRTKEHVLIYGRDSDLGRAYIDVPALRQTGVGELPPSEYLWVVEEITEHLSPTSNRFRGTLYWFCRRGTWQTADGDSLFRRLAAAYGTEDLCEGLVGVPVRWFTGEIVGVGSPCFIYGNHLVSTRLFRGRVKEGRAEARGKYWGMDYMPQGSLAAEAEYVRLGSLAVRPPETGRASQSPSAGWERKSVVLLAVKLNDQLRREGRYEPQWKEKDLHAAQLDLLLYMDKYRKAHLHVLRPDTLDADVQQAVETLDRALQDQPPGILRELWTVDGRRFPGYYLQATLGRDRLWSLTDRRQSLDYFY